MKAPSQHEIAHEHEIAACAHERAADLHDAARLILSAMIYADDEDLTQLAISSAQLAFIHSKTAYAASLAINDGLRYGGHYDKCVDAASAALYEAEASTEIPENDPEAQDRNRAAATSHRYAARCHNRRRG